LCLTRLSEPFVGISLLHDREDFDIGLEDIVEDANITDPKPVLRLSQTA